MSKINTLFDLINKIEDRALSAKIHSLFQDYLTENEEIEEEVYIDPYEGCDKKLISSNRVKDEYTDLWFDVSEWEYSKQGLETKTVFITNSAFELFQLPNDMYK
jgi:hypothetical protein